MIYKSKKKVQDIIDNYDGLRLPYVTDYSLNEYVKLKPRSENVLKTALTILKKQKKYHKVFNNNLSLGHYYVINGNMSYIGFEAGNNRKLNDRSFVKRFNEGNFFGDDWLIFQILLDLELEEWKKICVKCRVENVECFTGHNIESMMIFSKNTLDPGILEKKIPITGVVRIDSVNKEQKICYGSPLYLKMNYD